MTRSVHIVNSTLRRRFVVVTVFALVTIIIAVLVTIDTLRAARSEHQLATALTTSPRVAFEPEVTLGGFPYVKYADRDEFPGLVITARGVTAPGPPDLKGVPLTCTTTVCRAELGVRAVAVHASAADRWHGGAPITLRGVHAYAKLDSVNLGRMLDITDLTVNTPAPKDRAGGGGPGDGLLELSKGVLLTGTVSLPPQRPSPRTNGRFGPSAQKFDGQRVKVTVTVDLSVVDGELVILATGFYTGPQEHADGHVPAEFATAVLARFSGRVPYPTLPWAVVPTKANSAGSDILISGEAPTLTVRPDQF